MRLARQRVIRVARLPVGIPSDADFETAAVDVPEPSDGEFLARVLYLSLDPYLRSRLAGRHMGPPVAVGDVMPGRSVARIEVSKHPRFRAGEFVVLESGWAEWTLSRGEDVRLVDKSLGPLSTALGVLGMPGLTAWAGVSEIARPKPGDTFLVSAALGPVGLTAGQIAKIAGCRVVGIAGSPEKCGRLIDAFGFDDAVNHKGPDFPEALGRACRDGADVYFDNVGGRLLETAFRALTLGGTVVMCGLMSQYNAAGPVEGVNLGPAIGRRARLLGLVVYDYEDRYDTFLGRAAEWLAQGRLRYLEDRSDGLESAPAAFIRLMRGENVGKSLVVVSREDA